MRKNLSFNTRTIGLISAICIFGLVLALLPAATLEAAETKDRLVTAIPAEPDNLDPHQATTTYGFVHGLIFSPPISLGLENDDFMPYFAEDISEDVEEGEIRLTFDPEKEYHSERNVTAESYLRSLERRIEISPYAFDWDPLEDKYVEDDTVVLEFDELIPTPYITLQTDYDPPLDVEAAEELGDEDFDRAPVGSGPFQFEDWSEGSHIDMVRFDDYEDNLPFVENNEKFHFEEYRVRFIPEDFTRIEELQAGNVDLITDVPSEMLPMLEEDPEIELREYMQESVRYLDMNYTRSPFTDQQTRLGLAYAINRSELQQGLNETIEPVYSIVGPAMIRHHEETEEQMREKYQYDSDRARELLAEAGWEKVDGVLQRDDETLEFELAVNSGNPRDLRAAPIIQSQLEEVGIEVHIREYEGGYISEMHDTGDFDAILATWNWLDPGGVWPQTLASYGDYSDWTPTELDDLLEEAMNEPDDEVGAEKWGEITELVWEDTGIIPIWSDYEFVAHRDNVEGLVLSENGVPFLHDLKVYED